MTWRRLPLMLLLVTCARLRCAARRLYVRSAGPAGADEVASRRVIALARHLL